MKYGDKYVEHVLICAPTEPLKNAMSSFCADGTHEFKVWLQVETDEKYPQGKDKYFAGTLQFLSDGRVIFAPWDGDKDNPLKPA